VSSASSVPEKPAPRYEFADLVFDVGQHRLWRAGETVSLTKLMFAFLRVLVEAAPNLVTRDELASKVWGPRRIVTPENLAQHAMMLRRALHDDAAQPRYIEAVRGEGYRLVPSVRVVMEPQAEKIHGAPAGDSSPIPLSRRAAALVIALALAAAAWWTFSRYGTAERAGDEVALRTSDGTPSQFAPTTIAVLPFESISPDPAQEYFADGLATELMSSLAQIRELSVTGRTSSFYFKGKRQDVREIGRILGVAHVLEGTVRKADTRLRVTAQLVETQNGYERWSRTYDRDLDDIFAIQEDIAKSVADALQVTFGVGEIGRRPGMTRNVEAYDAYMMGSALAGRTAADSLRQSIDHLVRATQIDPTFARAWTELSVAYRVGDAYVRDAPRKEWSLKATRALEQARTAAPASSFARAVEAQTNAQAWSDWQKAGRLYAALFDTTDSESLEAGVTELYGRFLRLSGRPAAAIPVLERARATEPLDLAVLVDLANAYAASGDLPAATIEIERGAAVEGSADEDGYLWASLMVALATHDPTRIRDAFAAIREPPALVAAMIEHLDNPVEGRAAFTRMAVDPRYQRAVPLLALAAFSAYYDDPALALDLLNRKSFSNEDAWMPTGLVWHPIMKDVRKQPGFKDLVEKLGLVELWRESDWSEFCRPAPNGDFICQ
jgi:TolB-like protein/DNA-binding winged helix-turn-helix (wHTH) protein